MKKLSKRARLRQARIRRRIARRKILQRPARRFVDPNAIIWPGYTAVAAPEILDWSDEHLPILIAYLNRIRLLALGGNRRVLVDLTRCKMISPPACLMLTAELQRCLILRPNCLRGLDPKAGYARWTLDALGYYRVLGMEPPRSIRSEGTVLQIQTGGIGGDGQGSEKNPGQQTYQVAKIAKEAFKDEVFADRVHVALNEAADNAIEWAYDPDLISPKQSTRRWWICGFRAEGEQRAFFFAYDQGASIPRTAPKTSGEKVDRALLPILEKLGIHRTEAQDNHILEATIREQRTRSDRDERGKGLTRMIQLADHSHDGTVQILSGRARYFYGRERDDIEPVEFSMPLPYMIPGTLIVWHIAGPAMPAVEVMDVENSAN